MTDVLENNLNILYKIIKSIKDYISCFWQPSMDRRYYDNNNSSNENNCYRPRRDIDKKEHLSLDNVMLLKIFKDDKEKYIVTILGLRQDNCDDRISITNNRKEIDIIRNCLDNNLEIERKNIKNYMSIEEIENYNIALNENDYHSCLSTLINIEINMNSLSKEKVKTHVLKK